MKRKLLCGALLTLSPIIGWAQAPSADAPARHVVLLDLTGAYGRDSKYSTESSGRWYASAAGWRLWGFGAGRRLQVGVGGRVSHFRSKAADYELTGREPSSLNDVLLGKPYVPALLRAQEPRLTAINTALHVRARIVGPVRVGFTIDLLGLTFGQGNLYSTGYDLSVRPARLNLLRGGSSDLGTLNSEFYASADLSPRWMVRVGRSHVVNAFSLRSGPETDIRYHRFSNLWFVGCSYQIAGR